MREFHCDNSIQAHSVLWTSSLLPSYFHSAFFLCMYVGHFSSLTPQYPFLSPPPHADPPRVCCLHSCLITIIILGRGSTNERDIWPLSLAYLFQFENLQFRAFSFKWHDFIFLYGWVILIFHDMYTHTYIMEYYSINKYIYDIYTIFSLYIHWRWAPWLIPQSGYCEEGCSEHGYAGVSLVYWFILLQLYAQKWHGRVIK
jgi:hypothetical protein